MLVQVALEPAPRLLAPSGRVQLAVLADRGPLLVVAPSAGGAGER